MSTLPDSDSTTVAIAAVRRTPSPAPLAFDPVVVRFRGDGWTVDRQRDFLEALADSGIVRHAAAQVGMTEQSVNRLRRRAGAQSFDLACDVALRMGARRLRAIAFERAVEGQIKQHYFRGELVGEERVFDNRLLVCLLGKHDHLFASSPVVTGAERAWDAHLATLVDGDDLGAETPSGVPAVIVQPPGAQRKGGEDIWRDDRRRWRTRLPPPPGFDGDQDGAPGEELYERSLSPDGGRPPRSPHGPRPDRRCRAPRRVLPDRHPRRPPQLSQGPEPSEPSGKDAVMLELFSASLGRCRPAPPPDQPTQCILWVGRVPELNVPRTFSH